LHNAFISTQLLFEFKFPKKPISKHSSGISSERVISDQFLDLQSVHQITKLLVQILVGGSTQLLQ